MLIELRPLKIRLLKIIEDFWGIRFFHESFLHVKPWPDECNIAIQHRSTLLNATCWTGLAIMLYHVVWCWTKFDFHQTFHATSCNIVECNIFSLSYHTASRCMMWYNVERSLISIKHLMQHRSTFLLFSCVNNKVALVLPRTSTLLHSRTFSESSLRQGQRVVWPKIRDHYLSQIFDLYSSGQYCTTCCIRLAMQYSTIQQSWIQQYWMILHSFGQGFIQHLLME